MKRRFHLILISFVLACLLTVSGSAFYFPFSFRFRSAESTSVSTTAAITTKTNAVSTIASQVLASVNKYRSQYNLAPLVLSDSLSDGAQKKADDLHNANYFSHTSPTYGSPFDMMRSLGISYSSAGENIAMGYRSVSAVMNAWMQSPSHKANILSSNYTSLGVGYVLDGGYFVQWFIG